MLRKFRRDNNRFYPEDNCEHYISIEQNVNFSINPNNRAEKSALEFESFEIDNDCSSLDDAISEDKHGGSMMDLGHLDGDDETTIEDVKI